MQTGLRNSLPLHLIRGTLANFSESLEPQTQMFALFLLYFAG